MSNQRIIEFIRENKTVFIVIALGLFLIELEIFALAIMKSGRKSLLQITDKSGVIIHETDGDNLSEFNKYYFERVFGPFENYEVKLKVKNTPFPFRAWFVATLGIPIGTVLLLGFVFKAYYSIFQIKSAPSSSKKLPNHINYESKFDSVIYKITHLNIFIVGFLLFVAIISYWIVPDMINHISKTGIATIIRFKWFFMIIFLSVMFIGIWVIYLKYRLAQSSIASYAEIEKHRMQLHYGASTCLPQLNQVDNMERKHNLTKQIDGKIK